MVPVSACAAHGRRTDRVPTKGPRVLRPGMVGVGVVAPARDNRAGRQIIDRVGLGRPRRRAAAVHVRRVGVVGAHVLAEPNEV